MVKRWIAAGITLLACLMVVGCGVPEVEHSFEAAEYVNEEHSFSVKYPKSWEEMTPEHEATVFQAAGVFLVAGGAWPTPGVGITVADIEEGVSAVDALITGLKELGHTDFEVVSESETTTADGTAAGLIVLTYTSRDGYRVDALGLYVEKDGKYIAVFVWTANELEPFSEEQMSEVAHTLRFE